MFCCWIIELFVCFVFFFGLEDYWWCSDVGFLDFLDRFHVECRDGVRVLLVGHLDQRGGLVVDEVVHFAGFDVLVGGHGLVEPGEPPLFQVRSPVESSRVFLQLAAAGEHEPAEKADDEWGEARHHHGYRERLGRVDADDRLRCSHFRLCNAHEK